MQYLREGVSLLVKTLPFLWVRLGAYAIWGLVTLVYIAAVAGVAWLLGQLLGILAVIVLIGGLGGYIALSNWAGRYFFYLLKAAHVAVMTEILLNGRIPEGQSQLNYGKAQVMDRFKDTSILFFVDQLVRGVVTSFNRRFARFADALPIPGLQSLAKFAGVIVKFAVTYVDEAILSRSFAHREKNVWAVTKDGVLLYAQAWQPILKNAVALTLISFLSFGVALVILAIPGVAIGAMVPAISTAVGVFVLVAAYVIKLSIGDTLAVAATIAAYTRETEGLTPNPEWEARLEQVSDQFRELKDRAVKGWQEEPAATPAGLEVEAAPET